MVIAAESERINRNMYGINGDDDGNDDDDDDF